MLQAAGFLKNFIHEEESLYLQTQEGAMVAGQASRMRNQKW